MAHDYGVPLRFLALTPTRDNEVAPGNRMPDKHSRLFQGKTLDEWTILQLWSSKYLGKSIFICETEGHADKLRPLADKYGVELYVRPKDMLHPLNDSGSLPLVWATRKALDAEWFTLMTDAFVVCPCRKPGFFDMMVEKYREMLAAPDYVTGQQWVMGGHKTSQAMFELDNNDIGTQLGAVGYLTDNPRWRLAHLQHMMALSHWWLSYYHGVAGRIDTTIKPYFFDIEPWEDIHIDTEDQWELAEYYFRKKILNVYGEDCYERYRESWHRG